MMIFDFSVKLFLRLWILEEERDHSIYHCNDTFFIGEEAPLNTGSFDKKVV